MAGKEAGMFRENWQEIEKFGRGKAAMLALQHLFAMFGATILVPRLTGLDPAVALFTSAIGTLAFYFITRGRVPAYLGSSFSFIIPLQVVIFQENLGLGIGPAMVGVVFAGLIYVLVALVIKRVGPDFFKRLLPPVVVGPVIIIIGLALAPVAKDMFMAHPSTALVTLILTVVVSIFMRGFLRLIPILIGIVGGYIFALFQGLIDFAPLNEAAWLAWPSFTAPSFQGSLAAITIITPIALVTIVEHLGDVVALSKTVGKDFVVRPGLHRTLLGDGIATMLAGFFGGPPNTTYSENVGVLALTGVKNALIVSMAAVFVMSISFVGKFGALIQSIPAAVMGGITFLLFGMIAGVGLRTLTENEVDFSNPRNLIIVSLTLVVGLSGISLEVGELVFEQMGLAAMVGIFLNLILPQKEMGFLTEATAGKVKE